MPCRWCACVNREPASAHGGGGLRQSRPSLSPALFQHNEASLGQQGGGEARSTGEAG